MAESGARAHEDDTARSTTERALSGRVPRGRALVIATAALVGCQGAPAPDSAIELSPRSGQIDLACPLPEERSQVALRRLTRFEYANVVEDVLGVRPEVESALPPDELSAGFDNQAGTLGLTDLHVEAYLKLGDETGRRVAEQLERLAPLSQCETRDEGCARGVLGALAEPLLRRPPESEELERLLGSFSGDFSEAGFRAGISGAIAALLSSPSFLYRLERVAAESSEVDASGTARPLAAPEVLAARLSFLFWGSAPDDELLAAAREGRLASVGDVEREARRLWASPRARRGLWHFHAQWLGLADFDERHGRNGRQGARRLVVGVERRDRGWPCAAGRLAPGAERA
jgi:hypothetical protein